VKSIGDFLQMKRESHAVFSLQFPEGFMQGRAMFGGLVTGALVNAFEQATPGRPLRSLTASLCGPVQAGAAQLHLEVLREGSGMTTSTLKLTQHEQVLAHGTAVMGAERIVDRNYVNLEAPKLTQSALLEPLPVEPPMAPEYAKNFIFKTDCHLPFSEETSGHALGWIEPRVVPQFFDNAFLCYCVDAWWPAAFARESIPRPMATVAFTFEPFSIPKQLPMLYRSRVVASTGGFTVELRELWSADGTLLALNQQTIAYIK
jgi:hypothetical protein